MARPPADTFLHEAFNDQKCGQPTEEDRMEFYRWCISTRGMTKTKCRGIAGGEGLCDLDATFEQKTLSRFKSDSVPGPNPPSGEFAFSYKHRCHFGGEKYTVWEDTIPLSKDQFEEIYGLCYQGVYGVPYKLPWWLILIIVLSILVVLGTAFSLFWKYWLRQKIMAKKDPAFASGFTSAPYSSVPSNSIPMSSQRRRGSSASRRPSGQSDTRSGVSSMPGFNSKPSYMMSREPSVRSGRSSSSSLRR